MANELNNIIRRVAALDPATGDELRRQIDGLTNRRANGLNFERHLPEQVSLVGRPISVGDKVRFIPERGRTDVASTATWVVTGLVESEGAKVAELADRASGDTATREIEDLVFVADFRDPIYPGLKSTGRVERGGGKPFHVVINSENYHALEALLFTHAGQIDCIYIDPPYNSGARDWKYNNDYVDDQDAYRHSKWLSFMERRLKIAKRLLNPADSVLIVTIDEKEYLRLGLLLEQTFPNGRITMVSSSINSAGATRKDTFARAAEYLYFVQFGSSRPTPLVLHNEWNAVKTDNKKDIYWSRLIRSGSDSTRSDSANQFYPVFIRDTTEGPVIAEVGDAYFGDDLSDVIGPAGTAAVWPIRKDGSEGRWRVSAKILRALISKGHVRLGRWRGAATAVYYLKQGESAKVDRGDFPVVGHRADGSVITDASDYETRFVPTEIWRITSHDAGNSGSRLISRLIPGRSFPYPKSLYAVEDALRFFLANKPSAAVLDFFSGSGTTAHAVMRLNREDGGRRYTISVTNNEVSVEEQAALIRQHLRPGDPQWEQVGICDHITKPRIAAAITGRVYGHEEAAQVEGHYKRYITTDYDLTHQGECTNAKSKPRKDGSIPRCMKTHRRYSISAFENDWPMSVGLEENVEFFTLTYLNPQLVELDMAFASVAPLLWLRAGSRGRRIDNRSETFEVADTYAVLFSLDSSAPFLAAVEQAELRVVYIVTDDEPQFQAIASQLPDNIEAVRLYESYLRTFQINTERA